jgi:hypothetical protein
MSVQCIGSDICAVGFRSFVIMNTGCNVCHVKM